MRFSTLVASGFVTVAAWGASVPMLMGRDVTLTVNTDNAVASVVVPTTVKNRAESSVGGGADVAGALLDIVDKVTALIQKIVDSDIKKRQAFTQNVVARARQETGLNVIMSNVGYTFNGEGVTRTSTKFKAKVGADVSYDVITFTKGTFDLKGDGGFENWAFIVDTTCQTNAAQKHVSC